ncbi:MAG: 4Fe-4S binding protein [Oscillospiraceae bacterium]|jgi:NADH-quinone oxidoreductase subunit F|nr:4Fe-4S binding protein [Oscillospiraceae bacterium]
MNIKVGMGSCGIAAGAGDIFYNLEKAGLKPAPVGCNGMCNLEPIVEIDGKMYTQVTDIDEILNGTKLPLETKQNQSRIALRNCGNINPENIDEYIGSGGYAPLNLTPEEIIGQLKVSGLSGRGGAGFPTWFKWQAARDSAGDKKYVICNADEGDPGAFMDRAILEGDPHTVLEGMIIAAYAIGADEGIIYVRAEYPLAIKRLETAIEQARERSYLGDKFDIKIKAGAGAFVCGEETALIASLEGERGMPRLKPPFPAQKGFWGKPSNINNVETYANIPWIIQNSGMAANTKVFALTGKIVKGGLAEVPMGCTIREVVYDVGGGITGGKEFKAVQMGGPSGGCIPASLQDTPITYEALAATGAIMGSGGMVVMDESSCMVDMARFFLDFTCKESCGKCVHCRIGNRRLLEILERICDGNGRENDIDLLEELSEEIKAGSLCALGQTAPNPVLTTLKYFKNEYEDHIKNKKCPAKCCKPLLTFSIDLTKCKKCSLCVKRCAADAIDDFTIINEKCTKCGICADVCKFEAVNVT